MQLVASSYDRNLFNSLSSIELADIQARGTQALDQAKSVLGPIFIAHDLHDRWGLALLHKHWDLDSDELPLQRVTRPDIPREYELGPVRKFDGAVSWPSILSVATTGALFQPLEYSEDKSVAKAYLTLLHREDFLNQFRRLVIGNGWNHLFGLAALRSISKGYDLVEFNYQERVSALCEVRERDVVGKNLLETTWRFNPISATATCELCFSKCVIPASGGSHTHDHPKAHKPGFYE